MKINRLTTAFINISLIDIFLILTIFIIGFFIAKNVIAKSEHGDEAEQIVYRYTKTINKIKQIITETRIGETVNIENKLVNNNIIENIDKHKQYYIGNTPFNKNHIYLSQEYFTPSILSSYIEKMFPADNKFYYLYQNYTKKPKSFEISKIYSKNKNKEEYCKGYKVVEKVSLNFSNKPTVEAEIKKLLKEKGIAYQHNFTSTSFNSLGETCYQ